MRSALLLSVLTLTSLLAGCAETAPAPVACGEDEVEHPYEPRCLAGEAGPPHNERCNLFLGNGVTMDEVLFCNATSTDGKVTAAIDFEGQGSVRVLLRDGLNEEVVEKTFGPGQHTLPGEGEPGRWRLVVDFRDATGPVVVDLWG